MTKACGRLLSYLMAQVTSKKVQYHACSVAISYVCILILNKFFDEHHAILLAMHMHSLVHLTLLCGALLKSRRALDKARPIFLVV